MKIMIMAIFMIFLVLFIACNVVQEEERPYITFGEVSQSYLNQYGEPEEVNEYKSDDYHSIDWWWWSKGFMVSFLNTTYDDVNGWTVDHTYSFDPF